MTEDKNKKLKQEEFTLKGDNFENYSEHDGKRLDLERRLQKITSVHLKNLLEFWEEIEWNNYLYGGKEIDYFQLPVINACISEWKDKDCVDEGTLFQKCRTCLQIIDILNFAIAVCKHASKKQQDLWKEGIKNLNETIFEKLNYLSFMLLKDAAKYLNPKTQNMEYGVKDNDDNCLITLCLWANLYTAVRKQGIEILGFKFELPMNLVQENCAVRIMHTLFNHIFPKKSVFKETIKEDEEISVFDQYYKLKDANEAVKSTEEICDSIEGHEENNTSVLNEIKREKSSSTVKEKKSLHFEDENSELFEKKNIAKTKQEENEINFTAFDYISPPLMKIDIEIVNLDEYFIVGGDFYFDLYKVPQLNVRDGNFTCIHKEKTKLRRIPYKTKIISPRIQDRNVSHADTENEKNLSHELENAIFIQFQLPKKVMYLNIPEPAQYFPKKGGYSKDSIFSIDYKEDSRQISFKTNQFGIFGMLQKKYQNLPYKKWMLKGNDAVILSVSGSKLEIDIKITTYGYTVVFLNPDNDIILSEIDSTWMTSELLIRKLLAVGINIVLEENALNFANISKKNKSLEDCVYDCMALLCSNITFVSVSKCTATENEIILEYTTKKEDKIKRVIIRNNEVIDYEEELKSISKAKEALEIIKDCETADTKVEGLEDEEVTEMEKMRENVVENLENIDDMTKHNEKEPVLNNLYHYILHKMNDAERKAVMNTNACLIENVRTLLKLCRPISSM